MAVTPDGRHALTGGADGTARVWDLATGQHTTTLTGHTDWVTAVAVTPDGHEAVTTGQDGTIRVWNLHSGMQVRGTTLPAASRGEPLAVPLNDEATETDLLDIAAEVHRMAGLVVATSTEPPLSIALLADWGAGKSSFMLQIKARITQLADLSRNNLGSTAYAANVKQVRFNAWHYSDDHVWVGIVEEIFRELTRDSAASTPDPVRATRDRTRITTELDRREKDRRHLDERLARIERTRQPDGRLSWLASPARLARIGWAVLAAAARDIRRHWAPAALWLAIAGVGVAAWLRYGTVLAAVAGWVAAAAGPALLMIRRIRDVNHTARTIADQELARLRRQRSDLDGDIAELRRQLAENNAIAELGEFLTDRTAGTDYDRYRGLIGKVHAHLTQLDQLQRRAIAEWRLDPTGSPPVERIVLYVDDLDRCPPGRVVDVLAAVHLLLALPLFVVVVGVDARWLRRSLTHHDQKLFLESSARTAEWAADPMDYLDKIFQVPFALRAMDGSTAGSYLRHLLGPVEAPDLAAPPSPQPDTDPPDAESAGAAVVPHDDPPAGVPADRDERARFERELGRERELYGPRRELGMAATPAMPDLRPASLSLRHHEADFLAQLGALLPTPRAAKKLVNLYRLLRIGVPNGDLGTFAGPGESAPYRAAALLLAVLVGAPAVAERLLSAIHDAGPDDKLMSVLTSLDPQAPARLTSTVERLSEDPGLPADIAAYQRWAPELARYSFHTRPLWVRLTPEEQSRAAGLNPVTP